MIDVIPVSTETATSWFNVIRDGLNDAINMSGGYVNCGDVFRHVREGLWMLYIVMEDGEYVGFGTVELLDSAVGQWVNIPFAYSKKGVTKEFFNHIVEQAEANGMAGVKFVSGRPGFERVAKDMGWKKGFTEYIVKDFRG